MKEPHLVSDKQLRKLLKFANKMELKARNIPEEVRDERELCYWHEVGLEVLSEIEKRINYHFSVKR